MPYIQPGETRDLTPVALEGYRGGWQHGSDIYKAWRATWLKIAEPPAWASGPHAWQQLHINSPEDELRLRFTDLPKAAEECARHGVRAIQLVGWNDGGQDQGNPSHSPDPRLGTYEELKEAIARCYALGVKIILFSKYTWADRATARFRSDLVRLAIKDPYGDYYHFVGYPYQTATQLLDINTKRLIPMCFLAEEYLSGDMSSRARRTSAQRVSCSMSACTTRLPCRASTRATATSVRRVGPCQRQPAYPHPCLHQRLGRPDFLFCGEACYDWEFQTYQLSYHRSGTSATSR